MKQIKKRPLSRFFLIGDIIVHGNNIQNHTKLFTRFSYPYSLKFILRHGGPPLLLIMQLLAIIVVYELYIAHRNKKATEFTNII